MTAWLNQHATRVEASGRVMPIAMRLAMPRVILLDDVLSPNECATIIALAADQLQPSQTVRAAGGIELNAGRTSSGTHFTRGALPMLDEIDERVAAITGHPIANTEELTLLRYGVGERYSPHWDYFMPQDAVAFEEHTRVGGNRIASMIFYLNNADLGGDTEFPDLGLRVTARRGSALYFEYPTATPDTKTLHGGATVMRGEKWIATKWFRERALI